MSLSLAATAKIDLPSRLGMHRTPYARGGDDTCISAILRLDTKTDISVIKEAGFTPDIFRPGIALVSIPSSRLSELCAIDEVLSISYGRVRVHPTMDHARKSAGVDKIHSGIDVVSGKSYSGRGVIVGLMDQGMDPNHINFLDENGESRFSVIWTFLDTDGSYTEYSDNAVSDFTTEMPQSFHGTYTCGILAGSYYGAGMSAFSDKEGNCVVSECDIPYHGVAPDAEIVAGCGVLSDANIINAIENIIQYAKSQGKTPVINLSIGSTGGSFDLADPLCAYLNEAGREDAVIIAAAGNDGHKRMSLSRRFDTDTDRPLLTFLDGLEALSDSDPSDFFIEVWGDDQSHPDIDIVMHDRITGMTTTLYSMPDQYIEQTVIGTNESHIQSDYILSEELAAHFTGNIIVGREVNTVNQRSHTMIMTSINQLQYDNRTVIGLKTLS
ncbi:MAG: S8 family serine peptidase [Muribaculaceae bacterium]|nr:S8 family serine peptidase [Muribaculaceae bacterium]